MRKVLILIVLFICTLAFAQGDSKLFDKAKTLRGDGKFAEARGSIEELRKKYPNTKLLIKTNVLMGDIYDDEKQFDKAIEEYKKACSVFDKENTPAVLVKLSDSYDKSNQHELAILALWKLVNTYPQSNLKGLALERIKEIKQKKNKVKE